jgi:tripartite-type tricarboxylate transporter receptor subunit TctC
MTLLRCLRNRLGAALFGGALFVCATSVLAQEEDLTPAEFFAGKDISLYIGTAPGGAYDNFGRLVARHIGKHIPGNPTLVPVNMEGAGSLKLANWLYNAAPRDGTTLGVINRGTAFEPLVGMQELTRFDARNFNWLGTPTNDRSVCVAWTGSGLTHFDELYERPLYVGSTGGGSGTDVFPKIINGTLGTQLRVVNGYPGGNDIDFAMERGEVDGRCSWSWSSILSGKKDWLDQGLITPFLQLSLDQNPDLPHVPNIMDLARTEEHSQIFRLMFARETLGYPFLGPPDIPPDRIAVLRQAFQDTMRDPEFLDEATRSRLTINPVDGAEIEDLVIELYATPEPVIEKTRSILR